MRNSHHLHENYVLKALNRKTWRWMGLNPCSGQGVEITCAVTSTRGFHSLKHTGVTITNVQAGKHSVLYCISHCSLHIALCSIWNMFLGTNHPDLDMVVTNSKQFPCWGREGKYTGTKTIEADMARNLTLQYVYIRFIRLRLCFTNYQEVNKLLRHTKHTFVL